MGVRPGRLLPSVIVGGLLATGLAFGAGTASAADTCTSSDGVDFKPETVVGDVVCSVLSADALKALGAKVLEAVPSTIPTPSVEGGGEATGGSKDTTTGGGGTTDTTTGTGNAGTTTGGAKDTTAGTGKTDTTKGGAKSGTTGASSGPVLVPGPPPAPAPKALAAAPAANLLAPGGAGAGGLGLGALKGAPLAPGLFGVGAYNPGLLLGAPAGSPLANLAGTDPASAVTTTSQVQAMAFDGLPGGVGTPATIGVLILAGLAGFAVRHRVLTRMRRRDAALAVSEAPAA